MIDALCYKICVVYYVLYFLIMLQVSCYMFCFYFTIDVLCCKICAYYIFNVMHSKVRVVYLLPSVAMKKIDKFKFYTKLEHIEGKTYCIYLIYTQENSYLLCHVYTANIKNMFYKTPF